VTIVLVICPFLGSWFVCPLCVLELLFRPSILAHSNCWFKFELYAEWIKATSYAYTQGSQKLPGYMYLRKYNAQTENCEIWVNLKCFLQFFCTDFLCHSFHVTSSSFCLFACQSCLLASWRFFSPMIYSVDLMGSLAVSGYRCYAICVCSSISHLWFTV